MKVARISGYDWLTGALVAAIGGYVVLHASSYEIGHASHMGPGYFPMACGILLIAFGLAIILIEGRSSEGRVAIQPQFRALAFVSLGLASFGALIERGGLVPAVFTTVILCCLANKSIRPLPAVALAVAAVVLTSVVFVWGLKIPMKLLTWG